MDFKSLRAAKNKKAQSMIESSGGKVDASTFTPAELLNADAKTGMRPISRRAFKTGGKVEGEAAKGNLSRSPRGNIGLANTNQRIANEERDGKKHVGGFKRGGRTGMMGGGLPPSKKEINAMMGTDDYDPMSEYNQVEGPEKGNTISIADADRLLAQSNAEQRARGDMTRRASGGRTAKASGGSDDNYKEGVDFEWVKGDNTNAKTRHFFSKSEKADRALAPTTSPRPMARPAAKAPAASTTMTTSPMPPKRPVANVMQPAKITTSPLPEDTAAAAMKAFSRPEGMPNVDVMGNATGYKKGGKAEKFEGSAKDEAQDKKLAAKRKMTMEEWEASKADTKHDKQQSMKGLKSGGRTAKMGGGGMEMLSPAARLMKDPKSMSPAGMLASGMKKGGKADEDHDEGCACKVCGGRMGRATGGRAGKGKTNIVINVMPHSAAKDKPQMPPMPMPPIGGPPPMDGGMPPMPPPRMSLPPGLGAAMSGAAGTGPMPPPGAGPMPPPMMGRKDGGKVYPKMKFGAGSGKGRLEKIEKYGNNA